VSLGFDITSIQGMMAKYSLESGDNLYFVAPMKKAGYRSAYTENILKAYLDSLKDKGLDINYGFKYIKDDDVLSSLKDLVKLVGNSNYVVVWAVGGPRSIISTLILFSQIHPNVKEVYTFSESMSREVRIPEFGLELPNLSKNEKTILKFLVENGSEYTIQEIMDNINLNYNQVYRAVCKLKKKRYIISKTGRRKKFQASELGIFRMMIEKIL